MAYEGAPAGGAKVEFGPAPASFPLEPFHTGDRDPQTLSDRGLCFHLSDTLIDLTGPERVYSSRVIQQVTGSDGLQPSASVEISFNPSHERLVVHAVRVWRDGAVREAGVPQAFELLRRELNLERAVYDGRLTAHMIIPDVRVGDVVETAYSTIGDNPALRDAFSAGFRLQWGSPTIRTRCRVRAPATRDLSWKAWGGAPDPRVTLEDGVRELEWTVDDAPPQRFEPDTPHAHIGFQYVLVADRLEWRQVSDLFRDAYAVPSSLPDDLAAEIDAIAAAHPSPEARIAEGLRFVQGALRYHSIGIGEGGYKPRSIETIWATRYGDCKDASRLLTAVLQRLGVDAAPALVNTHAGAGLSETLPTATAFDHCIVRARIGDRRFWLDGTMRVQVGGLDRLWQPPDHWALPLVEGARLEPMNEPVLETVFDQTERWTFAKRAGAAASLEIETTHAGWRADEMRRWRDNDGLATLARRMREGLEGQYGQATELAPMEWQDDRDRNVIRMIERYQVDRPFVPGDRKDLVRFESRDDVFGPNLRTPETVGRASPLALGLPRRVRSRRLLTFPVKTQIAPWSLREEGPGMTGISRLSWADGRTAELVTELEVREREIPAAKAPLYFAFARKVMGYNGLSVVLPVRNGRLVSPNSGGTTWVSWAVVIGLGLLFAAFRYLAALG